MEVPPYGIVAVSQITTNGYSVGRAQCAPSCAAEGVLTVFEELCYSETNFTRWLDERLVEGWSQEITN